jgi:hypothetical protein
VVSEVSVHPGGEDMVKHSSSHGSQDTERQMTVLGRKALYMVVPLDLLHIGGALFLSVTGLLKLIASLI